MLSQSYPIFWKHGWDDTFENSLKNNEQTWKATSLQTSSPPYLLSNSIKYGVSGSTPDLWEFCEKGDHVDAWQMKKNLQVHKAFFDRKKSAPIIQGMVQGVLGGGENPFSPHDFFIFFIFSYQNLKVE